MYCSSLQWIPAGGVILSLAHIAKDIVHPTIDVYGLVVIVSHHVLDPGFCRLLEEKAFLRPFLILPRVLHHEPLFRYAASVTRTELSGALAPSAQAYISTFLTA